MNTEELIEVMLCVNDDNGNMTNEIWRLSIPDLIDLDGPMDGGSFEMGGFYITLEGKQFDRAEQVGHWVGNMAWESVYVTPQVVADILNHLNGCRGWGCEEAVSDIYYMWQEGQQFTAKDIIHSHPVEQEALFDIRGANYYER